ncbi:MAG: hypothetical protein OHK0039_20910 [Bacteroidia bacterium]
MPAVHGPVPTLLLALLLATGCGRQADFSSELTDNPRNSALDMQVHDLVTTYEQDLNTPGMVIGLLRNDSTFVYGYGERRVGSGEVPDAHTFFEIGSITKVFTAIATQQWLDAQGLSVDAPVGDYLPADLPTLEREGSEVTFRHLMTHSSGLAYMPGNMGPRLYLDIDRAWARYDSSQLYDCLRKEEPAHRPGDRWMYSNLAVGTLGTILERNTGMAYGDLIATQICDPLGLGETRATLSASEMERMSDGHVGRKAIDLWTDLNALDGAGVLRSTAADLLHFARANLDLPASTLGAAMQSCQQEHFVGPSDQDSAIHMGLGWVILNPGDSLRQAWFHDGGTGGFESNLLVFPGTRRALVVLMNSRAANKTQTTARVAFLTRLAEELVE